MKNAQTLSILPLLVYLCLSLFLFSSHVLSAATVPQQDLNMNTESSFATRSNPSLIQQTMTWILSFLKSLLTYKTLFVIIPIIVIWVWYDHDDVSMQKKPFKERVSKKSRSGRRQGHRIDSSEPLKLPKGTPHPDVEGERAEIQQDQVVGSKRKSEPLRQKEQLNVSHKEAPKNPFSSQKNGHGAKPPAELEHPIVEPSKPKPLEKRQKSDDESPNIGKVPSRIKLIKEDEPGNGWICMRHEGKWILVHDTSLKEGSKQETDPSSKVIILSNSFIPHQSNILVWIRSEFYTISEMIALSKTSKYPYFRFKQRPDIIISKTRANLYMAHPAYKTCVMDIGLRLAMIISNNIIWDIAFYTLHALLDFDELYGRVLDSAKKVEVMSYESFRTMFFSKFCATPVEITVKHFLARKFLENPKWTLEQLQNSRNLLREELEQIIKDFGGSPNYDFIPPVDQEMDGDLCDRIGNLMNLMNVPFYNCLNISRLLISSKQEPLRLFLFWDIFDIMKRLILFRIGMGRNNVSSLKDQPHVRNSIYDIPKVYTSQNKDYLELLCYEMIEFIQQDFFGNDQLYKKSGSKNQRRAAFDDYMLDVQTRVKTFLTTKAFSNPSVAIEVQNQ